MTPEQIYDRMHEQMVPLVQKHTVAIVTYYQNQPRQHATGTLLRFGNHWLLVSAGHALQEYLNWKQQLSDLQLFLDNGNGQTLVPLFGDYIATETVRDISDSKSASRKDQWDVAVWDLDSSTVDALTNKSFLNRTSISITACLTKGIFYLAGFPCTWAHPNTAARSLNIRAIRYIAHPHLQPDELDWFDSQFHLALNLSLADPMPSNLSGISGCSIWKLGDSPVDEYWTVENAKIVAVQTRVHDTGGGAIQGTKWAYVVRTIGELFPESCAAFNLWLPGPE